MYIPYAHIYTPCYTHRYWDMICGTHRDPHSVKLFTWHTSHTTSTSTTTTTEQEEEEEGDEKTGNDKAARPDNNKASAVSNGKGSSVWPNYLGATLNTKVE